MNDISTREGVGPVIITQYEVGTNPDNAKSWIHYTSGTVTATPGIETADLMGGDNTLLARIPVGSKPTIQVDVMEMYPAIEGGRTFGKLTEGVANASPEVYVRDIYEAGSSLKSKSEVQTILQGLTISPDARSGIYEIAISVVSSSDVSAVIKRISPSYAMIEPVALFSDWTTSSPASLANASPTTGDSGFFIIQVEDSITDEVSADLSDPTTYYFDIKAWSGQSGANASVYIEAGPCVASGEDTLNFERGSLGTSSMNFAVLGGKAIIRLVKGSKLVAPAGSVA